jgi:hypothetical protein
MLRGHVTVGGSIASKTYRLRGHGIVDGGAMNGLWVLHNHRVIDSSMVSALCMLYGYVREVKDLIFGERLADHVKSVHP